MWGLKGDSGSVCACRFQLLHIKHYCGFLTFHDWRKINSGGDKRRKDTLYTLLFAMNWSAALQGGKKTEIKDGRSIRSPSNDSKWCTFENDARVSSSIKQSCSCCCSSNITGQAQIVYIKYITYGSIDLYLLCHLVNRRSQILIRYQQISCQLLVYKYVKVCVYCIEWKQMSRVFFTLINMKKILLKLWNKSDQNYWQLWTACLHALRALSSRTSGSSNSFDAVRRRCSSSFMQHCTARSFRLHHLKSSVFIEVQWHCLIHRGLTHPLKDTDVVFKAFLSLLIVGLIDFTQMTGSMQTASGFPLEFPPLFWHIYLLVCPQKPFILRCFFYTTIHLKSLDY